MLKLRPKSLQSVVDALRLRLRKVSIGLDLALDVLELSLELLFRLDALHEHDIVVTVHFDELIVHGSQRNVLVLHAHVACHVLFNELHLGCRHLGLH